MIPDDEGMLPEDIVPDETVEGAVVSGPSDQPELGPPEPLEKWSDEDPDYVEFEDTEEDAETEEPEDLTEEELSVEPLESDPLSGPQWVRYELWGQNLDEESEWVLMATEDVDGDTLEAEIGQIPTATRMRFRLRLIDVNGQHSKWSEAVDITTPRDLTAPPAPVVPLVTNNNGFISITSTGELTGTVPPDMSHLNLYLQQMEGGEAGDPIMVTRFYGDGSGRWTTGNLPVVEHRAFLTAVDTTGNESVRSEYVYFVPDPPVDAARIDEEVAKVEERVGENLDQQLTVGLADILSSMADREESVIDRAKRESAEDAQQEYDRLQAIADQAVATARALSFDGDFETNRWDDPSNRWTTGDGARFARSTLSPYSGSSSMQVNPGGAGQLRLHTFPVRPGQVWRFKAAMVRTAATNAAVNEGNNAFRIMDQTGTHRAYFFHARDIPGNASNWTARHFDWVIPEGVTRLDLRLLFQEWESGWVRVDAVEALDITAAYEAISKAEAAQAAAAAAHEQVGLALTTAQNALTSANGKNRIQSSTAFPSGEGNQGDMWYRWSGTGVTRRLMGIWTWEGSSWRAMSTFDTQFIPQIDIGSGTIGQLVFDRISGFAAQVQHLAVGAYQNSWFDLDLVEWDADQLGSDLWTDYTRSGAGFFSIRNQGGVPRLIRWNPPGGDGVIRMGQATNYATPVAPGETYRLRLYGWRAAGGQRIGIRPVWRTRTGDYIGAGDLTDFLSGWRNYESEWTVPDNADIHLLTWEFWAENGGDGGGGSGAGRGHWGDFSAVKMVDGTVVVAGAMGAREINVQDLAADVARMNELWVGLAWISEGQFDNLLANSGKFKEINAPLVQSHTVANIGWKLKPEGDLEIYSPDGNSDLPMIRLGAPTSDGDMITLRGDDGTPAITMSQDGGMSARSISSERDPYLGGKPLAGELFETPRWHAAESVMGSLPLGVEAQHLRSFSTTDNGFGGTGEVAVTHLEAWITPGRLYRIACHNFEMGNREHYYMSAYYETSNSTSTRPARPTMNSIALGAQPGARPAVAGGNTTLGYEYFFAHGTAQRIRIIFAVGRLGGDAKTFNQFLRGNARFVLEDIGPNIGRTGQSLLQWAGSTSGSIPEPPRMLTQNYPVVQTATYTLNPSTGVATRQYTGGQPRFGYWTLTGQYHLTVVTFAPWNQAGEPITASPKMRVLRWGTGRGNIIPHGIPSFTDLPATFNFNTDVTQLEAHRNVGMGSIRAANLSSEQQMQVAGRANASLVLGSTGWASSNLGYAASGIFNPNGVGASLSTEVEE